MIETVVLNDNVKETGLKGNVERPISLKCKVKETGLKGNEIRISMFQRQCKRDSRFKRQRGKNQ